MSGAFSVFRLCLTPLLKVLSLPCRPFCGNFAAPYRAKDDEKIRLNMAVLSDIHLRGDRDRIRKLHNGMYDLERAKTPNDVMVSVGDLTDHGEPEHWELAEKIFAGHTPAKNLFLVLGNHDTWTRDEYCKNADELFFEYSEKISGRRLTERYFSAQINGYTLISLASESDRCIADISDRQLEWLEGELQKATADAKPVFVFCHQSFNITHGMPYTWSRRWKEGKRISPDEGSLGESSEKIYALLKKHKNVFYFSGHIHLGLAGKKSYERKGYASVESDGSLHKINVPCFMFLNHHGEIDFSGLGFQLEVYDNKVLLRPRSYASGIWYSKFDREFELEM